MRRVGAGDDVRDQLDLPAGDAAVRVDVGDDRFQRLLRVPDLGREVLLAQRGQVGRDQRDLDRVVGDPRVVWPAEMLPSSAPFEFSDPSSN